MITKEIKNAVMELLTVSIKNGNDGSFYQISWKSARVLGQNGIKVKTYSVERNGEKIAEIKRRYSSRKSCGCYRELKPQINWL